MAKLSLSVNTNTNKESGADNESRPQLSLTKKINAVTDTSETDNVVSHGLTQRIENAHSGDVSASAIDIAEWLQCLVGEEVFNELKNNPNLQLPYTDKDIDTKQWLEKIIKTFFSQNSILQINRAIGGLKSGTEEVDNITVEALVKQRMDEKIEKYNVKFQEMREKMENLEGEKAAVESKLNASLPLDLFVNGMFRNPGEETEPQKQLIQAFNEGLENGSDSKFPVFAIKFAKGWVYLESVIANLGDDEKVNLDNVYNALTKLLANISGCFVSERRIILDYTAKHCSTFFSQYDFISPEQTLNADPDIHNAGGLGNAQIKEGVSFAVVRRDTKKTVKYADIRV